MDLVRLTASEVLLRHLLTGRVGKLIQVLSQNTTGVTILSVGKGSSEKHYTKVLCVMNGCQAHGKTGISDQLLWAQQQRQQQL